MTGSLSGIDNPEVEMDVLRDLDRIAHDLPGWAEHAVVAVAQYCIPLALVAVVLLAWCAVRGRSPDVPAAVAQVAWAGLAAWAAYLINMPIRDFVARPRPADHADLAGLDPLLDGADGYAFVSDHASTAMAVAVALFLVHRWLGGVALVLALAQGFAQVLLGVHYPTDVVGGYALGTATALLLAPLALAALTPLARWCSRTRWLRWLAPAPAGGAGAAGGAAGAGAGASSPSSPSPSPSSERGLAA
ncbi:phosphatase PAP2 family protein [Streptomyces sp. 4N509B]|uniref:phosphatase PAP2 family protein n=1 Tax=Streptomyces sp. 4N509B TaxID=3457413 RepID=UPI003FD323F4